MNNTTRNMLRYHHWANETMLTRLQELPASVFHEETLSSYPTLSATLGHMYVVDHMWYLVLTGTDMSAALEQSMPLLPLGSEWDLSQCSARFEEQKQQYTEWIEQADLTQTMMLNNPYAGVRELALEEMVLQVVNHGTYHRGNMTTMLRQLGYPSVMNDYILYLYQQSEPSPSGSLDSVRSSDCNPS
ncbi:DinB family protein [Paenibacillus wenxiniae]|uniref:DinB family protein n=1 Tax=Paenibacillus wenxiniae TaxID=1636843 RepID=A0ABW4RHM0_9BACL